MDEELVLGPRRRLPRRGVQVVCASVGGVAVLVAAAVVALAPPALTGHGSEHVAPRPEIVQPLKGNFLT
ncbi:MAG: hypothetical protein M3Y06_04105 [Actinomycetota bacterium]|nr:hypothetical protein [Actinomycetota bacterium]